MKTRYFILLFLLSVIPSFMYAQDLNAASSDEGKCGESVEAILGTDLVSQYIWRGQDLGDLSAQTSLGVGYKGLSLTAWGSIGLTDVADAKEVDLTLSYTYGGFTIGLTDYWFSEGRYFQYRPDHTTHVYEAAVGYDFGFLSAAWYTNVAGADGLNGNGKRAFSSYFELVAPFRLGGLDWTGTVGIVPWETTFYGNDGFAVTCLSLRATKDFVIKERYHIPVYAALTANTSSEKVYLHVGVSFKL